MMRMQVQPAMAAKPNGRVLHRVIISGQGCSGGGSLLEGFNRGFSLCCRNSSRRQFSSLWQPHRCDRFSVVNQNKMKPLHGNAISTLSVPTLRFSFAVDHSVHFIVEISAS